MVTQFMRRASKVDRNHGEIVKALRSVDGVSVQTLASLGGGIPDLLIGSRDRTFLVEVKDGAKYPSERALTPDQEKWIRKWRGSPVKIILDEGEALRWARRIASAPGTHVDLFG